jgi:hypothetical protein
MDIAGLRDLKDSLLIFLPPSFCLNPSRRRQKNGVKKMIGLWAGECGAEEWEEESGQ